MALPQTYPFEFQPSPYEELVLQDVEQLRATTQDLINTTTGPALEIGGPTSGGFACLEGVKFPNGLVVTNLFTRLAGGKIDAITDLRQLPVADKSLGCIITAGLTRIPEEIAQSKLEFSLMGEPHLLRDTWNVLEMMPHSDELPAETAARLERWADPKIADFSLRIALAKEARRTLEPGGLIVFSDVSDGDRRLLKELGFELVAAGADNPPHMRSDDKREGDHIFRLTNLETAAGIYIEKLAQRDKSGQRDQSNQELAEQALAESAGGKIKQAAVDMLAPAIYAADHVPSEGGQPPEFSELSEAEKHEYDLLAEGVVYILRVFESVPDLTDEDTREHVGYLLYEYWLKRHPKSENAQQDSYFGALTPEQQERYLNQVKLAATLDLNAVSQLEVI